MPDRAALSEDALAVAELFDAAHERALQLHGLVGTEKTLELFGATAHAGLGLERYLQRPSEPGLRGLVARLEYFRVLAREVGRQLALDAQSDNAFLRTTVSRASLLLLAAVTIGLGLIGATTWTVSRRLSQALAQSVAEGQALSRSNGESERRNTQLQTLHQIVSQVTESLSLRYVVATAVREARRLVQADAVELRLLTDGRLELAGAEGLPLEAGPRGLGPGQGLAGLAANESRSVRLEEIGPQPERRTRSVSRRAVGRRGAPDRRRPRGWDALLLVEPDWSLRR